MTPTTPSGRQIKDGSIQRVDVDTTTSGQSVITKIIAGTGIAISSSTGADSGTGDVTLAISTPISIANGGTGLSTLGSANQLIGINAAGTAYEFKAVTVTAAGAIASATTINASSTIVSGVSAGANDGTRNVAIGISGGNAFSGTTTGHAYGLYTSGLLRWNLDTSGTLTSDPTNGGNLVISKAGGSAIVGGASISSQITSIDTPKYYAFGSQSFVGLRGSADSNSAAFSFMKSRATDGTGNTIVNSGDRLGVFAFYGSNGSGFSLAAQIICSVDATPGPSADMAGNLDFQLSPDGSSTTASVLKLTNDKTATFSGNIAFSSATPKILGGTTSTRFADNANANINLTITDAGDVTINRGVLLLGRTTGLIALTSVDGTDNRVLILNGGGDQGTNRGAQVTLWGNEGAGTGVLGLSSGVVGGSYITLESGDSVGYIKFSTGTSLNECWRFNASGQLVQEATNGGSLIMSKISTSAIIGATSIDSDITSATGTAPGLFVLRNASSNSDHLSLVGTGNNALGVNIGAFKTRATSAADANTVVQVGDSVLNITGYGAGGTAYKRAATILFTIDSGTPSDSSMPGAIDFLVSPSGSVTPASALKISSDKSLTISGDVIFTTTLGTIRQNTADAADSKAIIIAGGGASGDTRGATISAYGNEHANTGKLILSAGNVTSSNVQIVAPGSAGNITFNINSSDRILFKPTYAAPNAANGYSFGDSTDHQFSSFFVGNDTVKGYLTFSAGNTTTVLGSFSNHPIEIRINNTEIWRYTSVHHIPTTTNVSDVGSASIFVRKGYFTDILLNSATASRPLKTDASKNLISGLIDLSSASDITGTAGIANGGTGQTTQQAAINSLTNVSAATNEYVLTKDTATGNAVFKAAIATGSVDLTTNQTVAGIKTFTSIVKEKTHSNFTGSENQRFTAALQTTNATTATLATINVTALCVGRFIINVSARREDGTDKYYFAFIRGAVRRSASNSTNATIVGTPEILEDSEGTPGYSAIVDISSGTLRVRVTGEASQNVVWTASIEYQELVLST